MTPNQKKYSVVPPDENRCVWMTAGIVSYQLCDRAFECDDCPLNAAMRKQLSVHHTRAIRREVQSPLEGLDRLRDGYRYSTNHCWIKSTGEYTVRIGIEPGLATVLLDPKTVVIPSIGQTVSPEQPCAWIVTDGGTFPLTSPVSGLIVKRNEDLTTEPSEIFLHPYEHGWLFEVNTIGEDAAPSLSLDEARTRYTTDVTRFRERLQTELLQAQLTVGATLPDGGKPLQDVSQMLGARRYFEIVREVFGKKTT